MAQRIASLLVVLAVLFSFQSVSRGEEAAMVENPEYKAWAAYKPGTTVTYKQQTTSAGQTMASTMTNKLIEVTDEAATIEMAMTMTVGDQVMAMPGQPRKIPAKVAQGKANAGQAPENAKITEHSEGDEKITAGGKEYDCHWHRTVVQTEDGATATTKVWSNPEIPGGMVKMDSKIQSEPETVTSMVLESFKKGE